ncbi:MAG: hypothetical protein GEU98_04180 [Pseudonocardiaceae bacterium]|nr:hypothetical protein [Pseudonocardiaceae bacterium]
MTAGFLVVGSGVAGAETAAAADTSCLEESISGTLHDPAGTLAAVVGDPAGTLHADLACVREVLGI